MPTPPPPPQIPITNTTHSKPCTLCHHPRNVLIRCQPTPSSPWHFVCPGKCWQSVSGGTVDGDISHARGGYRYGGMWKNKHVGASAKMPRKVKEKQRGWRGKGGGKSRSLGSGDEDEVKEVEEKEEEEKEKDGHEKPCNDQTVEPEPSSI